MDKTDKLQSPPTGGNQGTPAPKRLGQDEINLTEFPIALLADRPPKNAGMSRRFTSGNKVWEILGHAKHGLPVRLDQEVYAVLMEISHEQGFPEYILFSRRDLLRRLGWGFDTRRYARLRQAFECWHGVSIQTTNSFYDKQKEEWLGDHGFHLLEEYYIPRKGEETATGSETDEEPTCWFRWSNTIRRNLKARYLKPFDVGLFLNLKSAVSQSLYRYLDAKRLDGKRTFQQGIDALAKQHLGMPESYYPSQIRRELDKAHEELIATGFLERAHYEPMRGRVPSGCGEKVVYRFAPQRVAGRGESRDEPQGMGDGVRVDGGEEVNAGSLPAMPQPSLPSLDIPLSAVGEGFPRSGRSAVRIGALTDSRQPAADSLVQQLVERGMTAKIAARLVAVRRAECERQLEYLPYRAAKNPGGTLRKAIEEAWAPPEEWQKAVKAVRCKLSAVRSDKPSSRTADLPLRGNPSPTALTADSPDPAAREAFAAAWAARTPAEQETLLEQALAEFRAENPLGATCLARAAVERQIEVLQLLLWEKLSFEQ